MFTIKRAYEPPAPEDGERILIDRLWPRGVSKERAAIDEWAKELAPSAELRRWFGHDPAKWDEFRQRYRAELAARRDALQALAKRGARRRITLVYGARDEEHNDAVVLREVLEEMRRGGTSSKRAR